jgi:predicted ATPase
MDLFYENLKIVDKKRIHFNEFMLNIHRKMHIAKEDKNEDPIHTVGMEESFS